MDPARSEPTPPLPDAGGGGTGEVQRTRSPDARVASGKGGPRHLRFVDHNNSLAQNNNSEGYAQHAPTSSNTGAPNGHGQSSPERVRRASPGIRSISMPPSSREGWRPNVDNNRPASRQEKRMRSASAAYRRLPHIPPFDPALPRPPRPAASSARTHSSTTRDWARGASSPRRSLTPRALAAATAQSNFLHHRGASPASAMGAGPVYVVGAGPGASAAGPPSRPISSRMEVSDQLMNVDIGLDANDLAYHHVDMEMATRIGRLINVYSFGFHQTVAQICAHAHDKRALLNKVGRSFLYYWSENLGVTYESQQVDQGTSEDAMQIELAERRAQADSMSEGLKKMVHLSLERMLHERVGLQEKDLLRSQLEAERQAHVATKRHADEVVAGLAQLRNQLEDYQTLADTARKEMHAQQEKSRRFQEQVQMLGVQLRVRDIEVASLKANENQLHSAAGALKAEVGFKEGQQVQLVENAQATLKSAQEAVLQKDVELDKLRNQNKELAWAKALLSGQVESLKETIKNHVNKDDAMLLLRSQIENLKVELEKERAAAAANDASFREREAKLGLCLERKRQKKGAWKTEAQRVSEALMEATQKHAREVEAMQEARAAEVERLHQRIEENNAEHERASAEHAKRAEQLVSYMNQTSSGAIETRDAQSAKNAVLMDDLRLEHAESIKEMQRQALRVDQNHKQALRSMAEENAKLFKRMQRADISAKYASEQMHVFKEEVVKNESQVAKLTDDMEKSRQEAALAKQDLALCQDKVKKLMGQMHLLEKSDAELRGTVDYLKIAGQELPKVQKLLEDANSKASEFKSRASGLHVELELARQSESRAKAELEKREAQLQKRLQQEQKVVEQQSSLLLERLKEIETLQATMQEAQSQLQVHAEEKQVVQSDQRGELEQLKLQVIRAERKAVEYKEAIEEKTQDNTAVIQQNDDLIRRLRADVKETHDHLSIKTKENVRLQNELAEIRSLMNNSVMKNDAVRGQTLKAQEHLADKNPSIRSEARKKRTDDIPLHPKLAVDKCKSLLAVTFQRAVAWRANTQHLAAPQQRRASLVLTPDGEDSDLGEQVNAVMDSSHLRSLGAVGNVVSDMEIDLRARMEAMLAGLETQVMQQIQDAQSPLVPKMDAALRRLKSYSQVLVDKLQYYRKTVVVLRFKFCAAMSQLDFASNQLHSVHGKLRDAKDENTACQRKLSNCEEKLRNIERQTRDEANSLLGKLKAAEQREAAMDVDLQAKEHKLNLVTAKMDSQKRRDEQRIARLRDITGKQLSAVDEKMRLIAQLKHDVRLFADESLAGFKHRMHSEVKEVVDMARKLDDREAALHAQVAQLQQEQLVVREDRDSLRKSHAVTVRTLEMTRVAGARVVLLHSWLQTMGKSTDAASEPPKWIKFSASTLNRFVSQIYAEKIFDDIQHRHLKGRIQSMRNFVYAFFARKFKVQKFAEMGLYGLLRGLDTNAHTFTRLATFSKFLGYDNNSYWGDDEATFFLHVYSLVLAKSPAESQPKAVKDDNITENRSAPPTPVSMIELIDGSSKLTPEIALNVVNLVLEGQANKKKITIMEDVMALDEVFGFISLDDFLALLMDVYINEKKTMSDAAHLLFIEADKSATGVLSLDDFTQYMIENHGTSPKDVMDMYVSAGETMNLESFSRTMWQRHLPFPMFMLHPLKYADNNKIKQPVCSDPIQNVKFHEFGNELAMIEESWQTVREIVKNSVFNEEESCLDEARAAAKTLSVDVVTRLDDLLMKSKAEKNSNAPCWDLFRQLMERTDVNRIKKLVSKSEQEVAEMKAK